MHSKLCSVGADRSSVFILSNKARQFESMTDFDTSEVPTTPEFMETRRLHSAGVPDPGLKRQRLNHRGV
jgi:hypothetical protein